MQKLDAPDLKEVFELPCRRIQASVCWFHFTQENNSRFFQMRTEINVLLNLLRNEVMISFSKLRESEINYWV